MAAICLIWCRILRHGSLSPAAFAAILRKLPARLYSIASSLNAHPEEVHLTIRKVRYEAHGRER